MTNRATTNSVQTESDSAMAPSTDIDNPDNLNFWEPGEEEDPSQANPGTGAEGIEGETDATAQGADQESGEPGDSDNADDAAAKEGDEPDDAAKLEDLVVTLKGGEQVPFKELKSGYLRERDYRLKTQEVASKRRDLDEMSSRVANAAQALANFLANQLPEEPSRALAVQDPLEYTRQKAIYDEAFGNVQKIIEMGGTPKQVGQALTQQQHDEALAAENARLAEVFPQTADRKGRDTFFNEAFETARELGFSDEEMQGVSDHRMFVLAHYARLGLAAQQAKERAMGKVNNAPPPAAKPRANGAVVQQSRKNNDAMHRLAKTGSMKDALLIDFE